MPSDFFDKDHSEISEDISPKPVEAKEPVAPVEQTPQVVAPEPQPVEPAAKVEPSAPVVPPPGYIPIAAQLDEREKRQRIEREFEEYKRSVEASKPAPQGVDPLLDPEGFEAQVNARIAEANWTAITTVTRSMAARHYGEDTVKAAEAWVTEEVKANPALRQQIRQQQDPYDFVVREHKRRENLAKYGDNDPDTFGKTWAEKNGYVLASSVPAAPAPVQPAALPRASIAAAASAGGNAPKIPVGNGVAHEKLFNK